MKGKIRSAAMVATGTLVGLPTEDSVSKLMISALERAGRYVKKISWDAGVAVAERNSASSERQ